MDEMTNNKDFIMLNEKLDQHRDAINQKIDQHTSDIFRKIDSIREEINENKLDINTLKHKTKDISRPCGDLRQHIEKHEQFDFTWKRGVLYAFIGAICTFVFTAVISYLKS
jgi:chromosome segregation ATPase